MKKAIILLLLGFGIRYYSQAQAIDNDSLKIAYMNALLKEQDRKLKLLEQQVMFLTQYGKITDCMVTLKNYEYVVDSCVKIDFRVVVKLDSLDKVRRVLPVRFK